MLRKIGKLFGIGVALAILALAAGNGGQLVRTQEQPPCKIRLAPGQSIQKAIDSAPAGSVICLDPGEWWENLVIEKSLTLRAAEIKAEPEVVIRFAKEGWPVIVVKSDQDIEVRIEGLKIIGAFRDCYKGKPEWICPYGIEVRGKAKAVIQNNTISDNGWGGILMADFSQATIVNNTIKDNFLGILMWDSSQATIANNTIKHNFNLGIWMRDLSQATIANNTIEDNIYGIEIGGSPQATITNNTFKDNFYGIRIVGSSQATIVNNTISGSRNESIVMVGSSQATIANNTISGNGRDGILMISSSQATIENNTISDNLNGIAVGNSSQATIRSNEIFENKGYGVALFQRPCYDTDKKFEGKVEGSENEIHDNGKGNVCPEELEFLKTSQGGCYGPKCD